MRNIEGSIILAVCLAATVAWAEAGSGQSGLGGGGSPTDSPYKNGPPPITGGYTDTTQGGTKTSGDMPAPPPGLGAKAAAQNAQPPKDDAPRRDSSAARELPGDTRK
jgi:hypothetical protein